MTEDLSSQATIKNSLNVSFINACVPTPPPIVTTQRLQNSFPIFRRTGCLEHLEDQAIISRCLVVGNSSRFIMALEKLDQVSHCSSEC